MKTVCFMARISNRTDRNHKVTALTPGDAYWEGCFLQIQLKTSHDNATLLKSFQPVSQTVVNKKYNALMSAFDAKSHKVRTEDGTPLAYVNRTVIYPPASADDDADNYDNLDLEMVARHRIVKPVHNGRAVDQVEEGNATAMMTGYVWTNYVDSYLSAAIMAGFNETYSDNCETETKSRVTASSLDIRLMIGRVFFSSSVCINGDTSVFFICIYNAKIDGTQNICKNR